jgi:hypothetical protein
VTQLDIPEGYAATNPSQNSLNTDENLPNTQDRHKSGVAKLINRNFNLHAFGFAHAKNRCVIAILMNFYSRKSMFNGAKCEILGISLSTNF